MFPYLQVKIKKFGIQLKRKRNTPLEIIESTRAVTLNLPPETSKMKYENEYSFFNKKGRTKKFSYSCAADNRKA